MQFDYREVQKKMEEHKERLKEFKYLTDFSQWAQKEVIRLMEENQKLREALDESNRR